MPVAEDAALGVVGLVLQAPGQQPVARVADLATLEVLTGDPGVVGARALHERAGVGQAALLALVEVAVASLGQLDHGVADDAAVHHAVLVGAVEDEHRQVDPDLAGGQARRRWRRTSWRPCRPPAGAARRRTSVTGRAGRCMHRLAPAGHRPHGAVGGELGRGGSQSGSGRVGHEQIVEGGPRRRRDARHACRTVARSVTPSYISGHGFPSVPTVDPPASRWASRARRGRDPRPDRPRRRRPQQDRLLGPARLARHPQGQRAWRVPRD